MTFVYLDTSVALSQLLAEDKRPEDEFWNENLISSRLLEYETWNRIHARKLGKSHSEAVRLLLGRVSLLELVSPILHRAIEPFSTPVRAARALKIHIHKL